MIHEPEPDRSIGSTKLKSRQGREGDAARVLQSRRAWGRTFVQIISVNVGRPREVIWKGMTVQTGIFKDPVDRPVMIRKLNLGGDQQADLTVHGGAEKAVYAYPAEHYDYWRKELPEVPFSWGTTGALHARSASSPDSRRYSGLSRSAVVPRNTEKI